MGSFTEFLSDSHFSEESKGPCDLPPSGWYCTRGKGHEGPCAAWPDPKQTCEPIHQPKEARKVRTRAEVLKKRRNAVMGGCCNRFADNMACSCLEEAAFDPTRPCGDEWKCSTCGTCNAGKAAKCMGCGK